MLHLKAVSSQSVMPHSPFSAQPILAPLSRATSALCSVRGSRRLCRDRLMNGAGECITTSRCFATFGLVHNLRIPVPARGIVLFRTLQSRTMSRKARRLEDVPVCVQRWPCRASRDHPRIRCHFAGEAQLTEPPQIFASAFFLPPSWPVFTYEVRCPALSATLPTSPR